jgi:hypothetical protein
MDPSSVRSSNLHQHSLTNSDLRSSPYINQQTNQVLTLRSRMTRGEPPLLRYFIFVLLTPLSTEKALRAHWDQRATTSNLRMAEDTMHFMLENIGTHWFPGRDTELSSNAGNGKGAEQSEASRSTEDYVSLWTKLNLASSLTVNRKSPFIPLNSRWPALCCSVCHTSCSCCRSPLAPA